MTSYYATIRHHSISRAPEVAVGDTLAKAKRRATIAFAGGFVGHEIVIYTHEPDLEHLRDHTIVATKTIGESRWTHY